jgi:hypothetical protein
MLTAMYAAKDLAGDEPPLSGLVVMLRHAAWLRPTAVTLTGGLAVAAMAATALTVFHDLDATILVLAWNFGVTVIIVGIGYLMGRRASAHAQLARPPVD